MPPFSLLTGTEVWGIIKAGHEQGGMTMVNQQGMQAEIDILSEKIETFEHLLKNKKSQKSDMDNYIAKKLAEYRTRYNKLTSDFSQIFGESQAG